MRNFFSIIIVFGVLLVAGGWVWMRQQEERTRVKLAEDVASAKRTFAQKARSAASEAEDPAYLRSMKAALSSYKEELTKRVFKDHPEAHDPSHFKKSVEEKFTKKELDEAHRKSMLEGYDIVKDAYDTLMSSNWQPILTAKGAADTRLDVYQIKKISDPDGHPILEAKFFFWGIEDSTRVAWGGMSFRLWKVGQEEVKEGGKKVMKDVEQVLGRSEGESQPHIIMQNPGKYIEDFPAFVSIGYLWFPILPHEATLADIEYDYRTKNSGGGESPSALKWEKYKLPDSWKLAEGQSWDADTVEATEDEIAGKSAAAEGTEGKAGKKK
jgi:hypothetical protein